HVHRDRGAAGHSAHHSGTGQLPGVDHERRAAAFRGGGAGNAECGKDHRRPHFQLPDSAFHGGPHLPDSHAGRGRGHPLPRYPPAQTRNSAEMNDATQPPADPAGQAIIHFDKVVKRFGDVTVLDSLDFEVAKGEKVTIIGPSGSGKSTVLRILMTLETINEGVIYVAGEPLWHEYRVDQLIPAGEAHLRDMRKKMGMVFQQFNLFPHMTVRRNITEAPVRVLGLSKEKATRRAEEYLDLVGLS